MSFATWWLYVAMVFMVSATTGPKMLLVMASGACHGMAGCLTALLGMLSLPAAGLSALLLTFVVIEVGWYAIYAAGGQRITASLRKPSVLKRFNRATGGVFVGFALLMADIRK